ncbi:MAG TPA: DUF1572 family protein [Planctomycetota bacterium]|nr:DUF1572 family protein [Planctomycetota bacterium]
MDDYLESVRGEFARYQGLGEKALAQVTDDARLHARLDSESNSLGVIVRHVGGNLASRWTDFLTSDGEKPDRNRDGEFEERLLSRAELLEVWKRGWTCLWGTLSSLRPADLARKVTIRGESQSVVRAIERSLAHTAYHVGQLVFLSKHLASDRWQTLSIARGKSKDFRPR